ncbi:MAG: hypothetical protein C7B45_16630 [Sulfobacillus acidophilus]|uniref:Permuted papain-like amidase enzyme, YaeF/YiiX, C92 family n=1 Tax=Sulfobacillus acidophilus TaxID=53633 RepID=A0A2T2WCW4_9FIRM|nr:MAG: hypothetical protein C7B45_16630 [Sulfobacillus acidophilus]
MYRVTQLQPGDIILCLPRPGEPIWDRLLDAAIACSTSGPFVHAALVGDGHLIEQVDPVIHSPLDKYAANGWVYRVHDATPAQMQTALRWAEAHVGQPYGIRALLADAALYDLHWSRALRWHTKYVTCSGFVALAWHAAGYPLTAQPLPSPMSLAFSPRLIGPRPWEHA